MAFYEATFVIRQDMSEKEVEKITEDFSAVLTEKGAKIISNEYWGLRNLAYKINKNRKGHYVMLGVDGSGEAIGELRRKLNLNEDIIRELVVKVEALSEEPSVLMSRAQT